MHLIGQLYDFPVEKASNNRRFTSISIKIVWQFSHLFASLWPMCTQQLKTRKDANDCLHWMLFLYYFTLTLVVLSD